MANDHVKVSRFEASCEGLELPVGLRLDRVELSGDGLQVSTDPLRVTVERPGVLRVTIREQSLASFLDRTAPGGLRDFSVKADAGKLIVEATKRVLIADIRAVATCHLEVRAQREVFVVLESVEALGGANVTNLVASQIDGINPVFNASDLPLRASLDRLECQGGEIRLFGEVLPPA